MNSQFEERRKFNRINVDGQVNIDFTTDRYDHCQVKNLSLTGMYVRGEFQQQSKVCCVNLFQTAKSTDISLRAQARVVRQDDQGIAVEFTSMTFDSYASLLTTLIDEAEEPLAIRKELPEKCPFEITRQ